jgi:hypothetical protein
MALTKVQKEGIETLINNNADNRVITGSGTANTLNGESNVVIDSSGNVGIGTTTPDTILEITDGGTEPRLVRIHNSSTNGSAIQFTNTDTGNSTNQGLYVGLDAAGHGNFYHQSNFALIFATNNSEGMRLDSSGNVGIGTTAPSELLTINGADKSALIRTSSATGTAKLKFEADGTNYGGVGLENTAIVFRCSNNSSPTERMRIDSSGNVGINESSPLAKFHVKVADSGASAYAHCAAVFEDSDHTFIDIMSGTTGSGGINFGDSGSSQRGVVEYDHNSDFMRLIVAGSERMRIDSAGRVSIGTTTNTAHLNVHVNAASRVPQIINDTNNTSTLTHRLRFDTGNTEVGRIRASNTATVYDTSGSDRTLKKNFEDWTENTLDLFKNINPQKFHFIQEEDTAKKSKGFIAQEMVDSFPEAYTKEDKEDSKYFFNPSGMVVYLMKALQEAVAKIEVLETKVAALEAA